MGLFDLAKDLIADSAGEIAKRVVTEKGKRIALGAGVAAATGIGAAATGALLGKKRKGAATAPPALPQGNTPPAVPLYSSPSAHPATPPVPVRSGPPAPPTFSFYAMIENVQRGPYNEMQFKRLIENKLADAQTLVWKEGMDEWQPACEVKMMAKFFPKQQQVSAAMPNMPKTGYFVNVNNQQVGPFTVQQLQQFAQAGEFTQQMFVWREGMTQWQTAGSVQELAALFSTQMPSMPQMPKV